jgi:hypothetical protein
MSKTFFCVHLNYEDEIRVTAVKDGLLIHDERLRDDEANEAIVDFIELVAGDERDVMKKTLASLYENFEVKSIGVEI